MEISTWWLVTTMNRPPSIATRRVTRIRSSCGSKVQRAIDGVLGPWFRLIPKEVSQVRQLKLASGYMSADEPIVYFGLGEATVIRRLTVQWPSGHVQTFENLAVDKFYTITEPSGVVPSGQPASSTVRLVRPSERSRDDHTPRELLSPISRESRSCRTDYRNLVPAWPGVMRTATGRRSVPLGCQRPNTPARSARAGRCISRRNS